MAFITAYRTDTGEQVRIPGHWIDHPELGAPFTTEPVDVPQPARQKPSDVKILPAPSAPVAGDKKE